MPNARPRQIRSGRTQCAAAARDRSQRRSRHLRKIGKIVFSILPRGWAEVYLFGSWAKGRARRTSDVDLGILPIRPLSAGVVPRLREALEESDVPYRVEVVDLISKP